MPAMFYFNLYPVGNPKNLLQICMELTGKFLLSKICDFDWGTRGITKKVTEGNESFQKRFPSREVGLFSKTIEKRS